jgi:hypothetical protein
MPDTNEINEGEVKRPAWTGMAGVPGSACMAEHWDGVKELLVPATTAVLQADAPSLVCTVAHGVKELEDLALIEVELVDVRRLVCMTARWNDVRAGR